MVIRHAEKPEDAIQGVDINGLNDKESLTVKGWQRAGALARFFAPLKADQLRSGVAQPKFLFASGPVGKKEKKAGNGSKSERPEQTLMPLSELLGAPVSLNFIAGQED
jgi:hypothetical protein